MTENVVILARQKMECYGETGDIENGVDVWGTGQGRVGSFVALVSLRNSVYQTGTLLTIYNSLSYYLPVSSYFLLFIILFSL